MKFYTTQKPEAGGVLHLRAAPEEAASRVAPGAEIYEISVQTISSAGSGVPYWHVSYTINCCEDNEWEFDLRYDDGSHEFSVMADDFETGYHYTSFFTADGIRAERLVDAIETTVKEWERKRDSDEKGSWRFSDAPTLVSSEYKDAIKLAQDWTE